MERQLIFLAENYNISKNKVDDLSKRVQKKSEKHNLQSVSSSLKNH